MKQSKGGGSAGHTAAEKKEKKKKNMHSKKKAPSPNKNKSGVCYFYSRFGNCKFGASCNKEHVERVTNPHKKRRSSKTKSCRRLGEMWQTYKHLLWAVPLTTRNLTAATWGIFSPHTNLTPLSTGAVPLRLRFKTEVGTVTHPNAPNPNTGRRVSSPRGTPTLRGVWARDGIRHVL